VRRCADRVRAASAESCAACCPLQRPGWPACRGHATFGDQPLLLLGRRALERLRDAAQRGAARPGRGATGETLSRSARPDRGGPRRAGFALNYVKLAATWADHQPAFFMATHARRREVVVAVRGTAQLEDVVTDLTALPEVPTLPYPIQNPISGRAGRGAGCLTARRRLSCWTATGCRPCMSTVRGRVQCLRSVVRGPGEEVTPSADARLYPPQVFGETGMLAHSGMQRAALWLCQRLSTLLRVRAPACGSAACARLPAECAAGWCRSRILASTSSRLWRAQGAAAVAKCASRREPQDAHTNPAPAFGPASRLGRPMSSQACCRAMLACPRRQPLCYASPARRLPRCGAGGGARGLPRDADRPLAGRGHRRTAGHAAACRVRAHAGGLPSGPCLMISFPPCWPSTGMVKRAGRRAV